MLVMRSGIEASRLSPEGRRRRIGRQDTTRLTLQNGAPRHASAQQSTPRHNQRSGKFVRTRVRGSRFRIVSMARLVWSAAGLASPLPPRPAEAQNILYDYLLYYQGSGP